MRFELDFWPGTEEARIIGEAIVKLGAISRQKDQDVAEPGEKTAPATSGEVSITEVKAETTAMAPRTRKPRKTSNTEIAEEVKAAAPLHHAPALVVVKEEASAVGPLVDLGPVALPVAAPAQVAKQWTKEEVENMFRPHTRTNFIAAKALLDKYGVARFSILPADKMQSFGDAVLALGPAPEPAK